MEIYIPTIGRVNRQVTLKHIPKRWLKKTYLIIPKKELKEYSVLKEEYKGLSIVGITAKGISKTREWILNNATDRYVLMLDDDMDFCYRPDMASPVLETLTEHSQIDEMLMHIQKLIKKYPMVGISARQGNNRIDIPVKECTRAMNAYAFDRTVLAKARINFGRLKVMEDFDLTLQLLRKGYKNAVIYDYCWNQRTSGAVGGCSLYRTPEMQAEAAHKLKKLHPDFVKVVEKESKSAWKGLEVRTDVTVQWKKAYQSSQVQTYENS